jgi:predicted nucleic acid-binding protein
VSRFVLDASVALSWVLDHPIPTSARRVRDLLLKGCQAIVPSLWHLEVANGLLVAERRRLLTALDVGLALQQMEHLAAQAVETDGTLIAMREAHDLGRAYTLSAYDAVYLAMAKNSHLPLATLDKALAAAARKARVPLLG